MSSGYSIHQLLLITKEYRKDVSKLLERSWRRCLRNKLLTMKVYKVETCEVESIENGRPINKRLQRTHAQSLAATSKRIAIPQGAFSREDNYSCRRCRQLHHLSNLFWRPWTREYLPSLQQCQKWNKQQKNLPVNDIVLLLDENTPRSIWPLGRAIEVYNNAKDGWVRSAKIATSVQDHFTGVKCRGCMQRSMHLWMEKYIKNEEEEEGIKLLAISSCLKCNCTWQN